MKKTIVIYLILACITRSFSQTYITVTNQANLIAAINTANSLAQLSTSQQVFIQFNNPGGIINLTQTLPVISTANGNGTITLTKHPSALVQQGIYASGFAINNCQNTQSNIIFNNLKIAGADPNNITWQTYQSSWPANGILLTNCEGTVSINTCTLTAFDVGIRNEKTRHLYVNYTEFIQNATACFYEKTKTTNINSFASESKILNCHSTTTCSIPQSDPFAMQKNTRYSVFIEGLSSSSPTSYAHSCIIKNNLFEGSDFGVMFRHDPTYNTYTPSFFVEISTNTFKTIEYSSITLHKPSRNFIIDGNSFYPDYTGGPPCGILTSDGNPYFAAFGHIVITSSQQPGITAGLFGLDFIGPNTLGLPLKNNSNIFSLNNGIGAAILCKPQNPNSRELEVNIIGLNIDGCIGIEQDRNTNIRECLLKNRPISWMGGVGPISNGWLGTLTVSPGLCDANCGIQPPVISYAYFPSPGNIQFFYSLAVPPSSPSSPIVNAKGPFVVELFKSNANGDLVSFLGSQTITSLLSSNQYSFTLNSTSLAGGDKVAMTITSLGTNSSPKDPVGTSPVSYYTILSSCNFLGISPAPQNGKYCKDISVSMSCPTGWAAPTWDFGDGTILSGASVSHHYQSPGTYVVNGISNNASAPFPLIYSSTIQVIDCATCKSCVGGFAPDPGNYILSLWVKEDNTNANPPLVTFYPNTCAKVSFLGVSVAPVIACGSAQSPIIDGWQRIETGITVPTGATQIQVELVNNNASGIDSYFDDIRLHPVDATMKSYVYDPVTLRLSAELDENNYGTYYEYDDEGKLIRVKKETEKGIMTIKETRSSTKKR